MRTWLLCLTLVDEVCLCLSALTCRNRDTAYSKINTQSRRERLGEGGRDDGGKRRGIARWRVAGLKVDKCTESETQDEAGSQWKEKRKRNMEEKLNARLFHCSLSEFCIYVCLACARP